MGYFYAFLRSVGIIAILLVANYLMTYLTRKFIGHLQARRGPMTSGFHGVLQPLADLMKSMFKASSYRRGSGLLAFCSSLVAFVCCVLVYFFLPLSKKLAMGNFELGSLAVFALLFLSSLGISAAGFVDSRKLAVYGSMAFISNFLSFSLPIFVSALAVWFMSGSMDFNSIVLAQQRFWFIVFQPLGAVVFLISMVRLAGRSQLEIPAFDTQMIVGPDAALLPFEASLVRLAESINLLALLGVFSIFYLGGWHGPLRLHSAVWLFVKVFVVLFVVLWIRNSVPWPNFDRSLARVSWRLLFPLASVNLLLTVALVSFVRPLLRSL